MSPAPRLLAAFAVTVATLGGVTGTGPASAADPAESAALFVSEINPDNGAHDVDGNPSTQDNFEFFEIANTTGAPIDLAAGAYTIDYNGSVPLTVAADSPSPAVVPAHGALVFWLRYSAGSADGYSSGSPNAYLFDAGDFRSHYGIDPGVPVVYAEGQPGMANSAVRSVGVSTAGTLISRSTYDPAVPDVDPDLSAHFAAPAAPGADATIWAAVSSPTPGAIDPAQLVPPTPPTEAAPLFVSEINPDNGAHDVDGNPSTQDNFEFFEIANRTDAPIDLALDGYTLRYNGSTELTVAADSPTAAVIPAGGAAAFWLRYSANAADGYSSGSPNSFLFDADDFRSHYGVDSSVPVVYVEGQPGMANGGGRSIVVERDSAVISRSRYEGGDVDPELSAHFRATPAGSSDATVWARTTAPTPGTVDPRQFVPQTVPNQGPPPATDPALDAPLLQVTEVAPDTANIGGADGYEFIEVYNASDEPIVFNDYTINYLYIDANAVTTNSALWPAVPADPVIAPGHTLVLWIKNGPNNDATDADFNAAFGSNLTLGQNLVEVITGGMANGGLRGIQVMTNTGHDISRAYYFNNDQTTATTAIQYAWNPAPSGDHPWAPADPTGTVQTLTGLAVPTPGYASPEQVPAGLVPTPDDTTAPLIEDLTATTDAPDTDRVELLFDITDDVLVRTVTLTLDTDIEGPSTRSLQFGAPDRYGYGVPNADLYGKRWVEYTVVASDGTHATTLGPIRIDLIESEPDPVRLNVSEGQYVAGQTRVAATTDGDPAELALTIDGAPAGPLTPALEASPKFVFEATNTDAFFRNGVKLGEQVLTIFDQGFYDRVETVAGDVPVEAVVPGEPLTLGIYAGTKAWPQPDTNENNDDFAAFDPRLALPDGRVLGPVECGVAGEAAGEEFHAVPCPAAGERIGFNDNRIVYFTATFDVPADAFDSRAHVWDTTLVPDGTHTVSASAADDTVTRSVNVDNTAPTIVPTVAVGAHLRGDFTIDAAVSDTGSGVDLATATLDGTPIDLPLASSSIDLAPGDHTLLYEAADAVGNAAASSVAFTTADERPGARLDSPADGATRPAGDVTLSATPSSPEGDELTVTFAAGDTFDPSDDEVGVVVGTVGVADAPPDARAGQALTAPQSADVAGLDGIAVESASATALPYHLFTVDVPADAGDAEVRVTWDGSANADAKVLLYVLAATGEWREVDRHVTTDAAPTDFTLGSSVPVAGYAVDGQMTFLVQHSEGFAGEIRSTRGDDVEPFHPDATARDEYDFTIGWESDTQYYNETFYDHQLAMHEFLLDQRDALNLQYVIHTGDIVDEYDQPYQWHNADPAYQLFDDAGLPYGVLAGNHDVGGHLNDYSEYSKYFGAARFEGNPWYGGSHLDNRGHYDLISADGIDFLMLYMGWAPGDEQIQWMNDVIAEYPERKVWINLHEYMLTTGGLGPIPQQIYDEVVAANPNVFAVSSGHYHDAYTRTDEFDDDGDGAADRVVYSMLFDYQGLPEGGLGYLRLLHFDNADARIVVRTYSPSLDDFDSDDASLNNPPGMQEFEIPYAAVGIEPVVKSLATDAFQADVLTTNVIATVADVPSGTSVEATWANLPAGEHGWYVHVSGPFGGTAASGVRTFTATPPHVTVPGAPSAVAATIQDGDDVRVTWTAPGNGGQAITHYLVQTDRDGRPLGNAVEVPASSTSLDLADLDAGAYSFTVRAVNAVGAGPRSAPSAPIVVEPTAPPVAAPTFEGIRPTRLFDSRHAGGPLQPGEPRALTIGGSGAVPGGATGVVVNLTVTNPSGPGHVAAWPCDLAKPHASSINYASGTTVANSVMIDLAADGTLCVEAGVSAVDLIADVTGYFLPESPFTGLLPARYLDSRPSQSTFDGHSTGAGLLVPGETVALQIGGRGKVPSGAPAVVLNLTATQPTGPGYVVAWPCDSPRPGTSTINYAGTGTVANSTVVELAADGTICVEARVSAVHLVADVTGYFGAQAGISGVNPARLLDTRAGGPTADGAFSGVGPAQPGSALAVQVAGRGEVPADATAAVLNLTVTDPRGPGHLTVWDCAGPAPHASSLNYVVGTTVANALVVDLSDDGTVCIQPGVSAVHVVADASAYFT